MENSHCAVNNVYLNGVRIAAVLPSGKAFYYLTDQVDSVKVVVNDSGMPVSRMEYLPFGDTWFQEGDTSHNPKYNSQELDKESGYYFYNARHYDAGIGRFVTPDTVIDGEGSTQGWNRYAYVHNNPIRYKDPTGHELVEPQKEGDTTSWNIQKGDTLSDVANQINKDLNMDVTVEDILKANLDNKAVKSKDKILAGGKLNLSFLKIEKSYTVIGFKNEKTGSIGQAREGNLDSGTAFIWEEKLFYNENSGRSVNIGVRERVAFSGKTKSLQGLSYQGLDFESIGGFIGKGDFNNMEDAKKAFFGESTDYGSPLVLGYSEGKQLSGYEGERGKWSIVQAGLSLGIGHKSKNEIWPVKENPNADSFTDKVKKVNVIFNQGNRQ